jgi:hypothetical protein
MSKMLHRVSIAIVVLLALHSSAAECSREQGSGSTVNESQLSVEGCHHKQSVCTVDDEMAAALHQHTGTQARMCYTADRAVVAALDHHAFDGTGNGNSDLGSAAAVPAVATGTSGSGSSGPVAVHAERAALQHEIEAAQRRIQIAEQRIEAAERARSEDATARAAAEQSIEAANEQIDLLLQYISLLQQNDELQQKLTASQSEEEELRSQFASVMKQKDDKIAALQRELDELGAYWRLVFLRLCYAAVAGTAMLAIIGNAHVSHAYSKGWLHGWQLALKENEAEVLAESRYATLLLQIMRARCASS